MFVYFLNKSSNLFAAEVEAAWGKYWGERFFSRSIGKYRRGGERSGKCDIDRSRLWFSSSLLWPSHGRSQQQPSSQLPFKFDLSLSVRQRWRRPRATPTTTASDRSFLRPRRYLSPSLPPPPKGPLENRWKRWGGAKNNIRRAGKRR